MQNGGTPQSAKKHRRRLSDGGKAGGKRAISRTSVSASCSPALARKTSLDTSGNTETLSNTNNEEEGCSEAVSSMSNQVSDDINEMVEQIQAIQHDISELAGRPISLVGGSKR